jgi:hypothetical protein
MKSLVKQISITIFCIFTVALGFSQTGSNYIKGIVMNEENEPLPYASIQFKSSSAGTISNEDGEFIIDKRRLAVDTIVVYFMGYKTTEFALNHHSSLQIITLERTVNQLSGVVVLGDEESYALGLLKKLIRKYRGDKKEQISKAFLSLSSEMDQPLEIFEAFYNARLSPRSGVIDLELKNGRAGLVARDNFSFVSLNTTDIIRDFSPFLKNTEQKLPLSPTNLGNQSIQTIYNLGIDYIIGSGEEQTAVVTFKPKNDAGLFFSGKYYIDINKNTLQKLTLESYHTKKIFLQSIQEGVNIDSLDILLEFNYDLGGNNLQSIIYNYNFLLSNKPGDKISSKALIAFYDYNSPFEMPISKTVDLDFDYHRILTYPYNEIFWENNYYIPSSKNKIDFTNFFKTNGYLINHDSVTEQSPYIESPFLCWDEKNRLKWSDIPAEKPVQNMGVEDGFISIYYQTEGNHFLSGHIFLDYETDMGKTYFYSRTSIDRSMSYLADLPRNLHVLLYINMYFDLYEIHRWHLIEELKSLKNPTRQEITKTYDEEMKNLYKDLDRLKKETQQGYKKEGLKKWNKLIEKQLGVNNFEAFGISEEECQAW